MNLNPVRIIYHDHRGQLCSKDWPGAVSSLVPTRRVRLINGHLYRMPGISPVVLSASGAVFALEEGGDGVKSVRLFPVEMEPLEPLPLFDNGT